MSAKTELPTFKIIGYNLFTALHTSKVNANLTLKTVLFCFFLTNDSFLSIRCTLKSGAEVYSHSYSSPYFVLFSNIKHLKYMSA